MIELFIEGQPVSINENFSTLISYAIDDIREFGTKNTSFSKTIILPGDKRNNKLFGNIFDVSGANDYDPSLPNIGINFNAAVAASAYLFQDNIQIVKGIVQMLEIVTDNGFIEYEVFITGELGGFAAKMGNKKLEDLDFTANNHTYSIANITASWNNASQGSGYYYPLIDYGNASPAKHNWIFKTFRPAMFAKEYIDKIFSLAEYTYDCALFDTNRFKSLIIPSNLKSVFTSSQDLIRVSDPDPSTFTGIGFTPFDQVDFNTQQLAAAVTTSDGITYTYNGAQTLQVQIQAILFGTYRGSTDYVFGIYKNGALIASDSAPASLFGSSFYKTITFDLTLNQYDYFYIAGQANSGFDINYELVYAPGSGFTLISASAELIQAGIGDTVDMNVNLPKNILQKDFISSIVKLFNLYIFEDPLNDKVLQIKPFIDFYSGAASIDWSLKLDRSKSIKIKPMSELNARYYEFNFKDDSDYWNDLYKKRYNQNYGSLIYDSEYEFAKEVEKVEVIFAGTPLIGYSGEDKVYSTIFKRSGEVTGAGEESVDCTIRILLAKKITGVTSYNILDTDGTTNLGSQTAYGYAGHFDDPDAPSSDIQFGVPKELFYQVPSGSINVNQFNVYWSSYMAEITDKDSRLLTGTFKLDYKDIYSLDFSSFIYVDGIKFRLNKIEDFNATNEDTCKVELLKIINEVY
jgi:hypothetical protein